MIGTSDGQQFEDEWAHIVNQLGMSPDIKQHTEYKKPMDIQPGLSKEDEAATIEAQRFPSNAWKINPKAFNEWLEAGPWEGNIEDRRFMLKEHTGDIKALIDRMNKSINRK